jgi:hypothetical protein
MNLVQILLPRADNKGRPFEREEFDRFKDELAAQFEGVTAYLQAPAEGLWRKGADSDADEIVIFEVMTEEVDLPDWRNRRSQLERRFRQDRVVIRYMPMTLI